MLECVAMRAMGVVVVVVVVASVVLCTTVLLLVQSAESLETEKSQAAIGCGARLESLESAWMVQGASSCVVGDAG